MICGRDESADAEANTTSAVTTVAGSGRERARHDVGEHLSTR